MNAKPDTPPVAASRLPSTLRLAAAAVLALINVVVGFFMAVMAMATNGMSDFQIYTIMAAGFLLTLGSSAYAIWSALSCRGHWAIGLVGQILALPIFVAVVMAIFELKVPQ